MVPLGSANSGHLASFFGAVHRREGFGTQGWESGSDKIKALLPNGLPGFYRLFLPFIRYYRRQNKGGRAPVSSLQPASRKLARKYKFYRRIRGIFQS